ncbi:MAG TPA: CHAD domain-containing protein [Steroidobacteraceae bacterium]|nr:CHAD domain-containing protein [Steroidobacteraceae bacterium]
MAKAESASPFALVTERTLEQWRSARRRLLDSKAGTAAVHHWRICTRRLLALEALLAPRASAGDATCEAVLQDAFRAAGRLRDAQVAIGLLDSQPARYAAAARISRKLRQDLPRLRRRVLREVRGVRTRELRAVVEHWNAAARGPHALQGRAARRMHAELRALARASTRPESQRALHQRRIRTKRLRYMLESCGRDAGLPFDARRALGIVTRQQATLGRITDLTMTLDLIERAGGKDSRPQETREILALREHLLRRYQQLLRRHAQPKKSLQIALQIV